YDAVVLSRGRVITRSCYHEVEDVTTHMGRFSHVLLEISLVEKVSEVASIAGTIIAGTIIAGTIIAGTVIAGTIIAGTVLSSAHGNRQPIPEWGWRNPEGMSPNHT
ncbi:hypothetical protein LSAT2_018193, partial [Lamellibrachia satsuma]